MSRRVLQVRPDVPAIHRDFLYRLPASWPDVAVGTIVRVPLHGRRVRGWVVECDAAVPAHLGEADIQEVLAASAGPPPDVVELCRWAAWRWAGPLATFLRAASPPNRVPELAAPEPETAIYPGAALTGARVEVVAPRGELEVPLAPEGSTLVIDPSATRAGVLVARWEREGRDVVTLGSEHPDSVRTEHWARARAGACVVIGGRAATWAPVPDLAAVVVLDEADEALEEERAPTWNARDVAFERAARAGVAVRVLTPAPTVDAFVAIGWTPRGGAPRGGPPVRWPRVEVIDQRDEEPGHGLLSAPLADALRRTVDRGARAVCVLNRRGRARLLACRTCGELARCEVCGATVEQVADDAGGGFRCRRCSHERPRVCLHCHGGSFRVVRPGIARVRDELAALLPRVDVVSVDTTTTEIPDVPVLVGTEAVLHRVGAGSPAPVGLVAYLELDQELLAPRARAGEQALWLVVRGARLLDEHGSLLLQTRLPDHEVVQACRRGDPYVVPESDAPRREALGFPPFGGLAELAGDAAAVAGACDALAGSGVTVLGPIADGASGSSRALLRASSVELLCDALADPGVEAARTKGRLRVDVDPRRV
jgi:primosomal protein N' (replication factor Y)